MSHIEQMETLVEAQQTPLIDTSEKNESAPEGFIWQVIPNYWEFQRYINHTDWYSNADRPSVERTSERGCDYREHIPSKLSLDLADRVIRRIQLTNPTSTSLAQFHIRRGDTNGQCPSTFSAVYDFLSCSFQNRSDVDRHFGSITFLMATDETDPCYRSSVCHLVEKGFGYGCVDLDETIQSVLDDYIAEQKEDISWLSSNVFIYHIGTIITVDPRVGISLERRRRQWCPACVDVVSEFLKKEDGGIPNTTQIAPKPWRGPTGGWDLNSTITEYEACSRKLERDEKDD
jgi:hypothetical protein